MTNMIFPNITEYELKLPYYITGVGCYYLQENVSRPVGCPDFQWIQCHEGRGELKIDGRTYSVGKKQGMLLYPDVPHEYYAIDDNWRVDWITFGGLHIRDFVKMTAGIPESGVFHVFEPDIILTKIRRVLAIGLSNKPMKNLECSCLAYEILVDLLKSSSTKSDNSMAIQYSRLSPLLEYIEKNYAKQLTMEELTKVINVTPQHLCTLFKKTTGLRIFEYINQVRIKKSKETLIQNLDMAIKEVALISGFIDTSYYCFMFRKIEHISPKEFVKLYT